MAKAKKKVIKKKLTKLKTKSKSKAVTKKPTLKLSKADKINLDNFITPLDDFLIVQAHVTEKVTAGGLIIPDTVSEHSGNIKGKVITTGKGHRNKKGKVRPMDVQKGDVVIFPQYSGFKINLGSNDFIIIRENDIMGILS